MHKQVTTQQLTGCTHSLVGNMAQLVDTPCLVPVAHLVQLWCYLHHVGEGIDDHIVDVVAPQQHVLPVYQAVPLVGSAEPGKHRNKLSYWATAFTCQLKLILSSASHFQKKLSLKLHSIKALQLQTTVAWLLLSNTVTSTDSWLCPCIAQQPDIN